MVRRDGDGKDLGRGDLSRKWILSLRRKIFGVVRG